MNIVITGASKGIGFETALALSKDPGNRIIALSRNEEKLVALKTQAYALGCNNIEVLKLDIINFKADQIHTIFNKVNKVDVLINNAGMLINKKFLDMDIADWHKTFETNLFGTVNIIKSLVPYLANSSRAHIVNIGSMGGVQGTSKFSGLSAYSSSKAALANLTECLAQELAEYGISVNCLALGAINTEMLADAFPSYTAPLNSEEISKFISYFSMNAHNFLNGKIIPVSITTP